MNHSNGSDKFGHNSSDAERNRWIRFEEQTEDIPNEVQIEIHSETDGPAVCATIEPTDSIHINATPDRLKRSSSSPLSSPVNVAPNQITNANIMSNIESNKVVDKKFNAYNNNIELNGETSTASTVTALQTVPLKDTNGVQSECKHTSCQPRSGFANGDVIVTVLPVNDHCAWLSPATFKPELVPEELMAQSLSLTVEDYVSAIQILVNDLRFNLYITLYKRLLVIWIALGFAVLLGLLFSGVKGLPLFVGGVLWLVINAFGIFASMFCKVKLYHYLERCISQVNSMLYKHNILLGIDDRGHISCHKINLVFVYFDVNYCIKFLKDMIENEENQSSNANPSTSPSNTSNIISRMDINTSDVVITGSQPKSVPQKEKYAEKLLLRYSQRWVKDFIRRKIDLNMPLHADSAGVSVAPLPSNPRHCPTSRCLCQFIEEHLKYKPLTQCSLTELFK